MSLQELISSGKLELYVAGVLSEREMGDIAVLAVEHPEVALEIEKIEQVMVEFLSPSEFRMPDSEKEQQIDIILGKIRLDNINKPSNGHSQASAPVRVMRFSNWAVAALMVGLILTTALSVYFSSKNSGLASEIASLKDKDENLAATNGQFQDKVNRMEQQVNVMRNILTKRVQLTSTGSKLTGQDSYMLVYWNPQSKKLLLVDANLPNLSPDQQYQLWALYDGKPIDAGVFDLKTLQVSSSFQKDVPNAQAFAVTVEPKGGSATPTLSNLCMMGKL
jgi:cell division protein FtsB